MEPRYTDVPRDWQNLFAITWFRYIEVFFYLFSYYYGKKNRSPYRGLRYIEVSLIYEGSIVVGQKILLRRVIATLLMQPSSAVSVAAPVSRVSSPLKDVSQPLSLPPFKLDNELVKIDAEFCDLKAAAPSNKQLDQSTEQATTTMAWRSSNGSNASEGKPPLPADHIFGPDGKHLNLSS